MGILTRKQRISVGLAVIATVLAGVFTHLGPARVPGGVVMTFVAAAAALSLLAMVVGEATEQLGERMGPGATGVLQSALGNLPELFVCIFSLRQGLVAVVQAALIGSILANSLLVLGLAILLGGLRHGTQRFNSEPPRMIATLMLLAVAALAVPTLAKGLHTPAGQHLDALSIACAVVLLIVFAASLPFSIKGDPALTQHAPASQSAEQTAEQTAGQSAGQAAAETATAGAPAAAEPHVSWPLWLALVILAGAGVGAAFVSDWFVEALTPATTALHLSQAFTGLVVVAIAGNAVENVVGIQLAMRNQSDYAISVILNSSLQIALGLTPLLVLLSFVIGGAHLTLVLPPMLVAALTLTAIVSAFIVYDGESIWLEGVALIGLYGIIAAAFWWG